MSDDFRGAVTNAHTQLRCHWRIAVHITERIKNKYTLYTKINLD